MSDIYRVYLANGVTEVFEGKDISKLLDFLQGENNTTVYTIGEDQRLRWDNETECWVHPIEDINDILISNMLVPFIDFIPLKLLPRIIEVEKKRNIFYFETLNLPDHKWDKIVKDLVAVYCSFLSDYKNGKLEGEVPIQFIKYYNDDLISITPILKSIQERRRLNPRGSHFTCET